MWGLFKKLFLSYVHIIKVRLYLNRSIYLINYSGTIKVRIKKICHILYILNKWLI